MRHFNPLSPSGLYFPSTKIPLAYHSIMYGDMMSGTDSEEDALLRFEDVYNSGELLCADLKDIDYGVGEYDIEAKDGQYVFLSLHKPMPRTLGYSFVYEVSTLLTHTDVLVGLLDMAMVYERILESSDYSADEEIAQSKEILRLGYPHINEYLNWAFQIPTSHRPARILDAAYEFVNEIGAYCPKSMFTNPVESLWHSELLVRKRLPLNLAYGVIYQKVFFLWDDFVSLVEDAGNGYVEHLSDMGDMVKEYGYPYRCPKCGLLLTDGYLAGDVVEDKKVRCESCGKMVNLLKD